MEARVQPNVSFLKSRPFYFVKSGSFTGLQHVKQAKVDEQGTPETHLSPTLASTTRITSMDHYAQLGSEDKTHFLMLTRQALYQCNHLLSPVSTNSHILACLRMKDVRNIYGMVLRYTFLRSVSFILHQKPVSELLETFQEVRKRKHL